jgi:hypothetical protein
VALLWACWCNFSLMALSFPFVRLGCAASQSYSIPSQMLEFVRLALVMCIPWVTFALAWRHETLGGLALCAEGLLLSVVMLLAIGQTWQGVTLGPQLLVLPCAAGIAMSVALPPLWAGLLLLSAGMGGREAEATSGER